MRLHSMFTAALLLAMLAANGQFLFAGTQSGRLAAFAARQDLSDMIAFAQADGKITPVERSLILQEAQWALSKPEYERFVQAFDRIAPPPPKAKPVVQRVRPVQQLVKASPAKVPSPKATSVKAFVQKTPAYRLSAYKAPQKVAPATKATPVTTTPKKAAPAQTGSELVMPASANLPDGVAPPVFFR